MKKKFFTLTMILLIGSICINTFAVAPDNDETNSTGEPKVPIHKSVHQTYIISSLENGVYTLTFKKALSNAEIKIYKDSTLIEDYNGSFNAGQIYTTDLQGYGNGEYTIEVYSDENKIFSGFKEI